MKDILFVIVFACFGVAIFWYLTVNGKDQRTESCRQEPVRKELPAAFAKDEREMLQQREHSNDVIRVERDRVERDRPQQKQKR